MIGERSIAFTIFVSSDCKKTENTLFCRGFLFEIVLFSGICLQCVVCHEFLENKTIMVCA